MLCPDHLIILTKYFFENLLDNICLRNLIVNLELSLKFWDRVEFFSCNRLFRQLFKNKAYSPILNWFFLKVLQIWRENLEKASIQNRRKSRISLSFEKESNFYFYFFWIISHLNLSPDLLRIVYCFHGPATSIFLRYE